MAAFFSSMGGNQSLAPGDNLFSLTRAFSLIMQDDGNLVLYVIDDTFSTDGRGLDPGILTEENYFILIPDFIEGTNYTTALWQSGTVGSGAVKCVMQADGNLVLYTADGRPVWASGTQGSDGILVCQDDGNLVIYDYRNVAVWSSNTFAGPR